MEERIIKDEYGRGIRLKKTKDGYVDVTDELAEEKEEIADAEAESEEEVVFEFPQITEDDEELAALMPEQAEALKKKREEERRKKQERYETLTAEGARALSEGDFAAAEKNFSEAVGLVEDRKRAATGLWKAKTENFAYPDRLPDYYEEYESESFDEFLFDVGQEAVDELKEEYGEIFRKRVEELKEEKRPTESTVLEEQNERREILSARKKKRLISFLATLIPSVLFLVCGIVFLAKTNSRPDQTFLYVSIGFFAAFALCFAVFIGAANKLINTNRMIAKNEDLSSTEEGKKLVETLRKEEFYTRLVG